MPICRYDYELIESCDMISYFSESLLGTRIRDSNLYDSFSMISFRNKERMMKIEELKIELVRSKDDIIVLKRDNRSMLKQHNVFCSIVRCLYNNITQLHLNCEIGKHLHKMIFHFLEL